MDQPISALMHREVWTVDMDATIADVERLLAEKHLAWVPVCSAGAPVGVLSAADVARVRAEAGDPATPAWRMCTYKPITAQAGDAAADVARLMVARHVHHVVVCDDGEMVGVVSALDFVRLFATGAARA
jgi:CBS domain-containing protein